VTFHLVDILSGATEGTIFRWVSLLLANFVLMSGIIFTYLASKQQVSKVSDQATRAAELALPTGNGFAKEMREAVTEIKETVKRVENKVDTHIQDHARQSLKD